MPRNSARISRMNFSSSTTRTRGRSSGGVGWVMSKLAHPYARPPLFWFGDAPFAASSTSLAYHHFFRHIESNQPESFEHHRELARQRRLGHHARASSRMVELDPGAVQERPVERVLLFEVSVGPPVPVAGFPGGGGAAPGP